MKRKEGPACTYTHYHALHVTLDLGGVATGEFLSPENEGRDGAGFNNVTEILSLQNDLMKMSWYQSH